MSISSHITSIPLLFQHLDRNFLVHDVVLNHKNLESLPFGNLLSRPGKELFFFRSRGTGSQAEYGQYRLLEGALLDRLIKVSVKVIGFPFGCLILGAGLLAGFTEEEFHRAVVHLPLPRLVRIMIVQIIRFLAPLAHEAVGISRAVLLRSGGSGGRGAVQIARALPVTWLPRVLDRSVRVSHAMEVRGYSGQLFDPAPPPGGAVARDLAAVIAAGLFPVAVLLMRILSP